MSLQEKIETPIVPLPSAWAGLGDSELLTYFLEPATRDRAFREILNRYQKRVYYHVRRIVIDHDDAADVVQNTFVKVLVSLEGFRSHSLLFTWIYRIATNEAITFLKAQIKQPMLTPEMNCESTSPELRRQRLFVSFDKDYG